MAVNAYITLDLMKPNQTLIDLTPNFNGRVGDSNSFIKLWFKSNGLPKDLTNLTPYFEGIDSNGTPFQIYGTAKSDQTGDNLQTGRISFYFPAATFQVEGTWDINSTFFGIKDENGTVISTVSVTLNVLSNKVEMGINSRPYLTDLEKVKQQMLDWINTQKDSINSMISEVTDKNSTLNQTLAALKAQLEAYVETVKGNTFVSQGDFETFQTSIGKQITGLQTQLVIQSATTVGIPSSYISSYPQGYHYEWVPGSALGLTGNYYLLETFVPDNSISTVAPLQRATESSPGSRPNTWMRIANSASAWGTFEQVTTW